MNTFTLLTIIGAAALQQVEAFSLPNTPQDRRSMIQQIVTASATVVALPSFPANALLDNASRDVPAFAGGIAEGKERLKLAIADIDDLLNNYDVITKSGGDNVRLYLGTQGVKSHMYGIMKVLKSLKEEADDIVEYTEAMDSFEAYKNQAEGAAYQSMFVEHSSAKGTPESFLKTAKGDIVNLRKYMGDLAAQLHLDV
uniref:Uncharacterized protein n=1 Tax=Skeletonema marinoi TaxID=267567 RepID=A0A7S2LJ50_9STRA|mmetsp:Transcript_25201/g.42815  ORF Transcript_25201/g.42815 Transcript_25201/m.42815 type:complete len:198 (+) Transcript_25201:146-739(+)|eukprot:scaffold6528_cov211-Skeletonema_marinoi.AAC.10